MKATAGNKGESVRSDCFVEISVEPGLKNEIQIKSKVKALYGKSIRKLIERIVTFYKLNEYSIKIEDFGALPFVLAARLEAAIRELVKSDAPFILDGAVNDFSGVEKSSTRRSRLYLPGTNPKLMINSGIYGCDAIILDMEDSVAPEKKYETRFLVRNALQHIIFYGAERMVRINQIPLGLEDIPSVAPFNVDTILIPKVESADQIHAVEEEIKKHRPDDMKELFLMPIIESALGVEKALEIASASPNIVALAIGLEDYTADIGAQRTAKGKESLYARMRIVNAAAAAGIQAIDSVCSELENMDELKKTAEESKELGFVGMGCIHPRQVPVVNDVFSPNKSEIEKAKKIVLAFETAEKEGKGVIALDSKMIDPPVVKRAISTIEKAIKANKLNQNWRESHEG